MIWEGQKSPNCVAATGQEHLGLSEGCSNGVYKLQLNLFKKKKIIIPKKHSGPFCSCWNSHPSPGSANGVPLLLKRIEAPGTQLSHFPAYLTG